MFDANFFSGNRSRLIESLPEGVVVAIAGHGQLQRNGSNTYDFRQDSSFWYLSGLVEPDLVLIFSAERELVLLPKRDASYRTFNGEIKIEELVRNSGIPTFIEADWAKGLKSELADAKCIFSLLPIAPYISQAGIYVNPARQRLGSVLNEVLPKHQIEDIRPHLGRLRMIKQPIELAAVKQACDITTAAFESIKNALPTFKSEAEILRAVKSEMFRAGADDMAYSPIAAAGDSSTVLHYHLHNRQISKHDLILIDAGAEKNFYASDITRTYSVSSPTTRQQAVHAAVIAIQKQALNLLKPGLNLKDYEKAVRDFAAGQLATLGLKTDELSIKKYFPHSTSHYLGLDVHDSGDYGQLHTGVVLTVEPGIYIPEEALGVRVEDNVVITDSGYDNLTAALNKELY